MSVEENKAIARRYVEEGCNHPHILDEIAANDLVWHGPNIDGLEAFKKFMLSWLTGFPDMRATADDVIAEKDKVTVRWTYTATHTGEFLGIPPTNKQATWTGVTILRIADGKVAEGWQWADVMGGYQQLGFLPSFQEIVEQARAKLA